MKWYYDETFHDRKIKQNDKGQLNIYLEDSSDSFIYSIVGFEDILNVENDYSNLEGEIKSKLGLSGELKSTTFKRKNFKYGIKSMSKHCKIFYDEFFQLLIRNNFAFQVGMISKTEYLVRQLVDSMNFILPINKDTFVYSLTKFIDRHRLKYLFNRALALENTNIQSFKRSIIELLEKVYDVIQDIPREKVESKAIEDMLFILKMSKVSNNYVINNNWDYNVIASGVRARLLEQGTIDSKIFVDNETNTFNAFIESGLNATQIDSKDSIGVRITDMFVGFVGRFIWALYEDLSEPDLNMLSDIKREAYQNKRILNKEWFNFDEKTFNAYKALAIYFDKKTSYWTSFSLAYFDSLALFFWFFSYIDTYNSYEDFVKNQSMHDEFFNSYCCECLKDRYEEMK